MSTRKLMKFRINKNERSLRQQKPETISSLQSITKNCDNLRHTITSIYKQISYFPDYSNLFLYSYIIFNYYDNKYLLQYNHETSNHDQ